MKKYTREFINNMSGWLKDRCREDWNLEHIGKLAILTEVKEKGIKAPIGKWEIEGVDFEIVD